MTGDSASDGHQWVGSKGALGRERYREGGEGELKDVSEKEDLQLRKRNKKGACDRANTHGRPCVLCFSDQLRTVEAHHHASNRA